MLFFINTFCISAGTKVVTNRGLVAIENVLTSDLVWDGDSWISQKGVLYKGSKSVIMAYGIWLTPNHKVRTNHGWTEAIQGYDREEIRLPDGYSEKWSISQHDTGSMVSSVRVREGMDSGREQLASGPHCELRVQKGRKEGYSRAERRPHIRGMDDHEGEVSKSKQYVLSSLRREEDTNRHSLDEVRELPERHGEATSRINIGTHRQQRELHKVELQMGDPQRTGEQHKTQYKSRYAEVYDILNCGPKQAFTVIGVNGRPLLVHNCFTYDPDLSPKSTVIPFITYYYQDVAFDDIKGAIEQKYDELMEKARRMGLTWIVLVIFFWFWLFRDFNTFRLLSIKEDLVDNTDDPDCLFWKLLFLLNHLPKFLKPEYVYKHMGLANTDNNSTITGYTTTSDTARSGRCTAMFPDEFATVPDGDGIEKATQAVTKCRLFNSTHQGTGTTFYRLSLKDTLKKLVLHWSLHPIYNRGLYYAKDGKLVLHDKEFKAKVTVSRIDYNFPEDYPFRLDGKLRSPWYDNECDRASHPMQIAQELDMDPFASDFQFFDGAMIQEIETEFVRPPFLEGTLEFDEDSLEPLRFIEGKNGPLKLWIYPDIYGKIPSGIEFGSGVDISAGTGASNSTASFGNLRTREKLAEYADPNIKPEAFARLQIAMHRWFNNSFMVPDGAGPGRIFCDELIKLGFRNLYFRRNEEGLTKKVGDKPGVFLNPKEKTAIFGAYRNALKQKTFTQRSHEANQECLAYVYTTGNSVEHSYALSSPDPSGAGASHGDRATADALLNKCFEFMGGDKMLVAASGKIPKFCYAARKQAREDKAKQENEW